MSRTNLRRNVGILVTSVAMLMVIGCVPQPGGGTGTPGGAGVCSKFIEVPLTDGSTWASPGSVSADGKRVAFVRGGRIIVRDVDTMFERDITGDLAKGLPFASLRISSDGNRVGVTLPGIDRADREGWIIDVETGALTRLDWFGASWLFKVDPIGFSGDLSAFVFWQERTTTYWIVPSDGSPIYTVELPRGSYSSRLNEDASVIAAGRDVLRNGIAHTYSGPDADTAWVVDLNRAGSRALVRTENLAYFWDLDSGALEALPTAPGEAHSGLGWARASDDGRYVVRDGNLSDGTYGVWRFDRVSGEITPLPRIFDGVTGISDDGRVVTSTNASYFRCSG